MSRLVRSGGQPRAMAGRAWVFTVVRGPGGGAAVCTAGEARGRTGQSPVSGAFLASANGDVKTSQKCKSGRLGDWDGRWLGSACACALECGRLRCMQTAK